MSQAKDKVRRLQVPKMMAFLIYWYKYVFSAKPQGAAPLNKKDVEFIASIHLFD